ncbi:hypothetical protein EAF00_010442 [Botryotinia globosa]|nr:hypothetical protein EAF00_010442 [Botryotinia globosa]
MLTNTSKSSNSNRILEIYNPNSEYQSDSDDMVNVRELTVEHRQELAQARQEIVQVRQELTAEHRQELAEARQELSQAHQVLAEARQDLSQAHQVLATTHAKVATLEEKLIRKVARNKELKNQLNKHNASLLLLKEEGHGCQIQARDNQIQKLKRHIQSIYILSAGLALLLLARVLLRGIQIAACKFFKEKKGVKFLMLF